MPNRSGKWSLPAQMQAYGKQKWTQPPTAPTIGTATAGAALCASVTFTAPSFLGNPPASGCSAYQVVSTPGCITASGSSSPITVTGLTNSTSYTFTVKAQNAIGFGAPSAASNSVTASNAGQQAYTTAGTYCWTAPSGVTSVSVVAVGGGGGVYQTPGSTGTRYPGGGGGGLGYKNNYSVTAGSCYTVVVGDRGPGGTTTGNCSQNGSDSYFVNTSTVKGGGGTGADNNDGGSTGRGGGVYTGDGGGNGGNGGDASSGGGGGGGGGGYSGNGGAGGNGNGVAGSAGSGGGGGGGGGGSPGGTASGGAGGGVGILGEGSSGAGGTTASLQQPFRGGGGSGGQGGGQQNSCGGNYGGGGGWTYYSSSAGKGGKGAVRIIWPGNTRSFPSTCTGNL